MELHQGEVMMFGVGGRVKGKKPMAKDHIQPCDYKRKSPHQAFMWVLGIRLGLQQLLCQQNQLASFSVCRTVTGPFTG